MGSLVTPAECFSESGVGINDIDRDGLDDLCEQYLAERFRPLLATQPGDCDLGREPRWAAKYFPRQGNVVRIAYLLSYYVDCGASTPACEAGDFIFTKTPFYAVFVTLSTLGLEDDLFGVEFQDEPYCAGHQGDSEFLIVEVVFDSDTEHWVTQSAFLSAHYGTQGDNSRRAGAWELEFPDGFGRYPMVWVSKGKHANYVSRSECNAQSRFSLRTEDCLSETPLRTRLEFFGDRNVGSLQVNLPRDSSCVAGGLLHDIYPELYSLECYWLPGYTFAGWSPVSQATDASAYSSHLVTAFECWRVVLGDPATCVDWGVNR
ncbi:MAG TPA: hypothetical protein VNL98_14020 [Gemmatimonadales bacterium]|nr:hypothetical protein [Gemmatimonadales bacterium]